MKTFPLALFGALLFGSISCGVANAQTTMDGWSYVDATGVVRLEVDYDAAGQGFAPDTPVINIVKTWETAGKLEIKEWPYSGVSSGVVWITWEYFPDPWIYGEAGNKVHSSTSYERETNSNTVLTWSTPAAEHGVFLNSLSSLHWEKVGFGGGKGDTLKTNINWVIEHEFGHALNSGRTSLGEVAGGVMQQCTYDPNTSVFECLNDSWQAIQPTDEPFRTFPDAGNCKPIPPPDTTAPGAPTDLSLMDLGGGNVFLQWAAPAGDTDVSHYDIQRAAHGNEWAYLNQTPVLGTDYVDYNTTEDVLYFYQVQAIDHSGNEGDFGDVACVRIGHENCELPGASTVDMFWVKEGQAQWSVGEVRTDPLEYKIQASMFWDDGPWIDCGEQAFSGTGVYEVELEPLGFRPSSYRVVEVEHGGTTQVRMPYNIESYPDLAHQAVRLSVSELKAAVEEELGERQFAVEKTANDVPLCVLYVPGVLLDVVNDYLVRFWRDFQGVSIEVVNIDQFSQDPEILRPAIKASIAVYHSVGVELFHLIGDASEHDEFSSVDPVLFPNIITEPEKDLIPTYYFYDDDVLAYLRPYYSSDFPYGDVDNDGLPDVVVTRWPVANNEELLSRIYKAIIYNQYRQPSRSTSEFSLMCGVNDVDIGGNTGARALQIAQDAISSISETANVNVSLRRYTQFEDGFDLMRYWEVDRPDIVLLISPHANKRSPCGLLRTSPTGTEDEGLWLKEKHPALIIAANCLTGDFASTDLFVVGGIPTLLPSAEDSWAERWDRGSIAWIGPTGTSFQRTNEAFSKSYMKFVSENPEWSMAKSWMESVREALTGPVVDEQMKRNLRTYAFLGDPLSRLEKKRPEVWLTDITDESVGGIWQISNTADWVDFDSDGDDDLYLSYGELTEHGEVDAKNKVIQNVGGGALQDITPSGSGAGIGWDGPTMSAAWADIDNDGDQDLYIVNGDAVVPNSPNLLFVNAPASGLPQLTQYQGEGAPELEDNNVGGRAEWIDVDIDGDLDLFVARPGLSGLMFKSLIAEGTGGYESVPATGLTDFISSGYYSWGDYDSDGFIDVFVFGDGGANVLLRNNGDWTFSDVTSSTGLTSLVQGPGMAAAWGDYDNDGDFDLYVGLSEFGGSEQSRLLRNDGTTFVDVTEDTGLQYALPTKAVAWSDFDNDGDLDLICTGEANTVYENHLVFGEFQICHRFDLTSSSLVPLTVNVGDYDSDGDEDVYVGEEHIALTTDHSRLFRNDIGGDFPWVKVKLQGVVANRDGIGARIELHTENGVVQTRQLVGSVGGSSHSPRKQLFGLGPNSEAKKVRVEWPQGRVTEVPLVQPGQTITITDEFAAPQGGSLYLTTDSSGALVGQDAPVPLYEIVDLYLAVDLTAMVGPGDMLSAIEGRVVVPDNVFVVSEEVLNGAIDSDPGSWSYSLQLDECVPSDQGPIPLVHLRVSIVNEGEDPTIALANVASPAFSDPIEATVPSWIDCASDVLYRLDDPSSTGGVVIPFDDTKNPLLIHSGLWMDNRNVVLVSFDEPLDSVATNGMSYEDESHFKVYNATIPSTTKVVTNVLFMNDHEALVILESDILDGKAFNIEISNMQDVHGNPAGVVDGVVTTIDSGGGGKLPTLGFNEVMTGDGTKKSGDGDIVYWVELMNEGDRSVSLNGWTVEVANGVAIDFPESPILILQPGELGVLAGTGYLPDLLAPDVAIYHSDDSYGEDTGMLLVSNPFGEQTDSVNTGAMLKTGGMLGTSLQRFLDGDNKSISWIMDAPEYAAGLRGTPGKENRTSAEGSDRPEIPASAHSSLLFAAPNPFNPMTSIFLTVKERGHVSVVVYDLRGRRVRTLYDQFSEQKAQMELVWNGADESGARVASGTYFVKMRAPDGDPKPMKILLVK